MKNIIPIIGGLLTIALFVLVILAVWIDDPSWLFLKLILTDFFLIVFLMMISPSEEK